MAKENWDAIIASSQATVKEARKKKAIECDHNTKDPVVLLSEFNKYSIQNRSWFPENAVIHPECGTIFDSTSFTEEEVFKAFLRVKSIPHQIKYVVGSQMDKEKLKELNDMLAAINNIEETLTPFYNDMVKTLAKQDDKGNRNNNNRRKMGRIGITADVYNS